MRLRLIVATIAGPVSVLAAAAWLLVGAELFSERGFQVKRFDQILMAEPEVVLIGNSQLGEAVDPEDLQIELEASVATLVANGSRLPMAYAVLQHRIVANGHRPRLILVFSMLKDLIYTGQPTNHLNYSLQVTGPDPVLDRKVHRQAAWRWRFKHRRAQLRAMVTDGARDRALALAGFDHDSIEPSLERVFDPENLIGSAHRRVIPVVEIDRERPLATEKPLEDSLIADFAALAEEIDAKLVFVRTAVQPGSELDGDERRLEEVRREVNRLGAGWIDLSRIDLRVTDFRDQVHANVHGRARITAELATALRQLGALGPGPLVAAPPPTVSFSRLGKAVAPAELDGELGPGACGKRIRLKTSSALVELQAAGEPSSAMEIFSGGRKLQSFEPGTCAGDFRLDGGVLELGADIESTSLELGWALQDSRGRTLLPPGTRLEVHSREEEGGKLQLMFWRYGDGPARLISQGSKHELGGGRHRSLDAVIAVGSFTLEAASSLLMIDALRFAGEDLIGSARQRVLPDRWLIGHTDEWSEPVFEAEPQAIEATRLEPRPDGGIFRVWLPQQLHQLGFANTSAWVDRPCSPVRLVIDEQRLRAQDSTGSGEVSHFDRFLLARIPDHDWDLHGTRIELDSNRWCAMLLWRNLWLYPGDRARFDLEGVELPDGVGQVELLARAAAVGDRPLELVAITTGGREFSIGVDHSKLSEGPLTLEIVNQEALAAIELRNPSTEFVLIENLRVVNASKIELAKAS